MWLCLTRRDLLQQSRFAPQNRRLQIHRHADHQVVQTVETTNRQTDVWAWEPERFNTWSSMWQHTHMIWYDAQEMFLWKRHVQMLMTGQTWERDVKECRKTLLPSLTTQPGSKAWIWSSLPLDRRSGDRTRHWLWRISLEDQERHQTSAQLTAPERERAGCSAANRRNIKLRLLYGWEHLCFAFQ